MARRPALDAVVIGAGMGGLTCAALLAKRGLRVAVFEQHDRAGGYCSSFVRDGYTFDVGVDSVCGLGPRGRAGRILGLAGAGDGFTPLRLPEVRGNVFPTEQFVVPDGLDRWVARLTDRFPGEANRLPRFFAEMAEIARGAALIPPERLWDGHPRLADFPALDRWRRATYLEFVQAHISDPVAWAWLAERTPYVALPPGEVSAVTMAVMLMSYFQDGAWRVRGGYQRLADRLAAAVTEAGGAVHLETPVQEILVDEGCAVGVRTHDGHAWTARHVVANGDLTHALTRMLPADVAGDAARIAADASPSLSLFLLYLGARLDLRDFRLPSSLGIFPTLDVATAFHVHASATGAAAGTGFGLEIPTLVDPSLAPAGRHVLIVHYPVRYGVADAPAARDALVASILDRLEATVVPGLRAALEVQVTATPRTLERFTRNRAGSPYGFAQTPERYALLRDLAASAIPGLHVVGHWGDYGGGVPCAIASGYIKANLLCGTEVGRRIPGPAAAR